MTLHIVRPDSDEAEAAPKSTDSQEALFQDICKAVGDIDSLLPKLRIEHSPLRLDMGLYRVDFHLLNPTDGAQWDTVTIRLRGRKGTTTVKVKMQPDHDPKVMHIFHTSDIQYVDYPRTEAAGRTISRMDPPWSVYNAAEIHHREFIDFDLYQVQKVRNVLEQCAYRYPFVENERIPRPEED